MYHITWMWNVYDDTTSSLSYQDNCVCVHKLGISRYNRWLSKKSTNMRVAWLDLWICLWDFKESCIGVRTIMCTYVW